MCLYPRLIDNPKYKANKKNGGNIPPLKDKRLKLVPIACGDCIECRKKKSREIQIRLLEDIRHNKNATFIALTFSNENYTKLYREIQRETKLTGYDLDNAIAIKAMRRFLERWRKKHKKSLRHWIITELGHGETEHIHYHGIVWMNPKTYLKENTNQTLKELQKEELLNRWQYGDVWVGDYVNEKTVNYISKYITKVDKIHEYYKPVILTSPGIGAGYTNRLDAKKNKYQGEKTKEYYTTRSGHKIALPIYWRNKIYTEEERENLWINKLDKEKRYIMGMEIDISKGDEVYYKALKNAQKLNKDLGYGTGEIDWERKLYEKQRRILNQRKRLIDEKPNAQTACKSFGPCQTFKENK